jgi:hypothetical protein
MDGARRQGVGTKFGHRTDERSKKNIIRTRFGRIEVAKKNIFSEPVLGSRTSPYLQSKLVLLGCEHVYGEVPEIVESLLGVRINKSQVYRVCQAAAVTMEDGGKHEQPSADLQADLDNEAETVYGMVDGSMLPMHDGWQETKVGRVFKATLKAGDEPRRYEIRHSEYAARRGHWRGFAEQFERLLPPESAAQKVFVTDGATWIEDWLSDRYPESHCILDFYHVCERLAEASQSATDSQSWFETQKGNLLAGQVWVVEDAVRKLSQLPTNNKQRLLGYLGRNRHRMHYDVYLKKGWMIGSGPIESAHRTVLQVRMKRSGQHWGNDCASCRLQKPKISSHYRFI